MHPHNTSRCSRLICANQYVQQSIAEALRHEDASGVGAKLHALLISTLDGSERSTSHSGHITFRAPDIHCVRKWKGVSGLRTAEPVLMR
jgi:hypothetical protein